LKQQYNDEISILILETSDKSVEINRLCEDAPKRGKGSHTAMVKREPGKIRLVIIPNRKIIPKGTLRSILDQAGLTRDEFISFIADK
jgi:hypothetical protein